jgi:lysine 2,3-aminomutase
MVMATLRRRAPIPPSPRAFPRYPDWRAALADAVTDAAELCRLLNLPASFAASSIATQSSPVDAFPLRAPKPFLARIRPGDPNDPLLLQILPRPEEGIAHPAFHCDPLGEHAAAESPSLLGKYPNRRLILASGRCAVHCRFCFRRHFPRPPGIADPTEREELLRRIAADASIHEIVLSGCDPLTCDDDLLAEFAGQASQISHLRRLRIHSRMPIVIPQRVDALLLGWLRSTRLTPVMVAHVNHPAEIDAEVADALGRLVDAGVPVLSQTVLLRGVNDEADVLAELFERLVDLRAMPYYLHQLDRVAGAAHFEVPVETGRRLIEQIRARLPGYAVPRYVQEVPGASSKRVLR